MFWFRSLDITYWYFLVHVCCYWWITSFASPYAVFNAQQWVSAVAQPIGIGQCLPLIPRKLALIRSSLKMKSSNSLRKGFSNIHVQLAFAWHVNISIVPATCISKEFFVSLFNVVLFTWRPFYFTLSSLDAQREREIGWFPELTWHFE